MTARALDSHQTQLGHFTLRGSSVRSLMSIFFSVSVSDIPQVTWPALACSKIQHHVLSLPLSLSLPPPPSLQQQPGPSPSKTTLGWPRRGFAVLTEGLGGTAIWRHSQPPTLPTLQTCRQWKIEN